jgi:hypothetical protein
MGSFELIGGVGILGYLSPMDTEDNYAVIDPIYGIDGLRNVNTLEHLNLIPEERRRAGMIVGVNGGETYYKLKNITWTNEITDWVEIDFTKELHIDRENPLGDIDGNNKEFFLSKKPVLRSEHVFLNGVLQESDCDYSINDNKIIFNESPQISSRIRCSYRTLQ